MRILVDTNVLISAFVFGGKPKDLILCLLRLNLTLCVSSYIDDEFRRKLAEKWPQTAKTAYDQYIQTGVQILTSTKQTYGDLRDAKDIPILSDAVYYGIDVILTGDRDFLEAGLDHPAVMTPAMLWDALDGKITGGN